MRAIGFTGEARHGKDTAANMLANYLRERGDTVRVTSWANKLKVSAARALGAPPEWDEEDCVAWCDEFKHYGRVRVDVPSILDAEQVLTGREFLERLGTEGGRQVHGENVWVDLALPAPPEQIGFWEPRGGIPDAWRPYDWHIDTTTRFESEVKRIREWDGWIIRIERPDVDNGLEPGAHPSRAGIPREECDAVIINDGSLAQLCYCVEETLLVLEAFGDIRDMLIHASRAGVR